MLALALACFAFTVLRGPDRLVRATIALALAGLIGLAFALADLFRVAPLSVGFLVASAGVIAFERGRSRKISTAPVLRPISSSRLKLGLALIVLAGSLLRLPPSPSPLAGRDPGSYSLRAKQLARSGSLDTVQPVLASRGTELRVRSGAADIIGLYSRDRSRHRRGFYESAYRPGWYLADRNRGEIVPQFFHLQPVLAALARLSIGEHGTDLLIWLEALLSLALFSAISRHLWPRSAWALWSTLLYASFPLLIWGQRLSLSEGLAIPLTLASLLAFLRVRDGDLAALRGGVFALGALAWVRGNAFLTAPVVLLLLLFRPRHRPESRLHAPALYFALLLGSVAVHAYTVYPYLHDELIKQLPFSFPLGPPELLGLGVFGLCGWWLTDGWGVKLSVRRPRRIAALATLGFLTLSLVALIYLVSLSALRNGGEAPYSRLDALLPLFGIPLLSLAFLGWIGWLLDLRSKDARESNSLWLLILSGVLLTTLAFYTRRNLPQVTLYYYGRYLLPELLPAVVLGATACLARVHGKLRARRPTLAAWLSTSVAAALLFAANGVLVRHPSTLATEYEGAQKLIEALAKRLPDDAVVIAGGEGWHHGHTFNQVAGALEMGEGITVLPYRSREAAYATLHELLVTAPTHHQQPAPPVYLLINEVSHHYRDKAGRSVAGIDDLLPAPFRAQQIDLLEMFTDSLTPSKDGPPTRITRHQLRMALIEVELDRQRAQSIERWHFEEGEKGYLPVKSLSPKNGELCLEPGREVSIKIPPSDQNKGAGELVLVASPGTSGSNPRWKVKIDGRRRAFKAPGLRKRNHDTLGPFPLKHRPKSVSILVPPPPKKTKKKPKKKTKGLTCPYGGLHEIRWLPPEESQLSRLPSDRIHAHTLAPDNDRGHPVEPTHWVSASALSRYRPGLRPKAEIHNLSLHLEAGRRYRFAPHWLPRTTKYDPDEPTAIEIVLTLTKNTLTQPATLRLYDGKKAIGSLELSPEMKGRWSSPSIPWESSRPLVELRAELEAEGDASQSIDVRDLAFFSQGRLIPSQLLDL